MFWRLSARRLLIILGCIHLHILVIICIGIIYIVLVWLSIYSAAFLAFLAFHIYLPRYGMCSSSQNTLYKTPLCVLYTFFNRKTQSSCSLQ